MKKFLVLVAVFALAISMGPVSDAFAEATVYGKMHMSLDYVDADSPGNVDPAFHDPNWTVASNSTRLGFKGTQRLDNGNDLIWQIESGISADGDFGSAGTSGSAWSLRNRFLGLKGGLGTFMLGIHDTPFKKVSRAVELFPEWLGDSRSIVAHGASGNNDWDLRASNAIMWMNKWGSFGVFLMGSMDTDAGNGRVDDNSNSLYSGNVSFKTGAFTIIGAFERHNITANHAEGARLGVDVKLGDLRLVGFFQKLDDLVLSGTDRDTIGIGAAIKLGNITLKAQAYEAGELGGAAETGARGLTIGADTKLSKTTTAYGGFAQVDNDDNTDAFSPNGHGTGHGDGFTGGGGLNELDNGSSPNGFTFGVIYDF